MFKFFAICLLTVFAVAAAKPGLVAPLAYSSASLVAASPYTAAYASPYASPYYAAYTSSYAAYASPYVAAASPYAAAYSTYPYSSLLLRR